MKKMVHPLASNICCLAHCPLPHRLPGSKGQKGTVAIMFVGSLTLIIGLFGMALDLSRVYNRKIEMQGVADTVALAAARKLNGTAGGVTDALSAAHDIMQVGDYRPTYNYTQTMNWNDAAIKFGRSVNGVIAWVDSADASASPDEVRFVKVDTIGLDAGYSKVSLLFMPVVSASLTSVAVSHVAVAGRRGLGVTPLAICAMSSNRQEERLNPSGNSELVEYGFRRGVSYDLMNLNPNFSLNGPGPVNFLVDPIAAPGGGSSASDFAMSTIGPYVCAGTVALPKVIDATVSVQSGFPLASLFDHLNSRFDMSNGACNPYAAPPDTNIKPYPATALDWMNPTSFQTANSYTTTTLPIRLETIADLPPPNNQAGGEYGPLWAYARAVPWSSVGQPEPVTGYAPFAATDLIWDSLYPTGTGLSGYPSGATATPYITAGFSQAPTLHRPGIKNRRVLNIPLLACPVTGSIATVVGIGKFFMTVPADAAIISAEFAGLASERQLGGPVEITQ
jgi:hypothetical protein